MSETGNSMFYIVDPSSSERLQPVDPKSLLEQRAAAVWQQYNGQDLPNGTVVDEVVIYTLEDRPVVKERITELLEKRLVAKEFVKQVKLVTVRTLPKHSEILSTNLSVLSTEVLASNPWLGERELLSTTTTETNNEKPNVKASEIQKQQENNPSAFTPITAHDRSDSAINTSPEIRKPRSTKSSSTQSTLNSTDKGYQKCGNPFRAFIRVKKPSNDGGNPLPTTHDKNPFKSFVKSPKKASDQAIVPAKKSGQEVANTSKLGRLSDKVTKGVSLKWSFSKPFSPPQSAPVNGVSNSGSVVSGPNQNDPSSKPNLQPFLDQSVSNTDLGKEQAEPHQLPSTRSGNTEGQTQVESVPTNNEAKGERTGKDERASSAPKSPRRASNGQSPSTPRRSKEVLDSVQELPSRRLPSAPLSRQKVDEASYQAATRRCQAQKDVDLALATETTEDTPVTEYFTQEEEYRTVHEIVEQFVEHNYYLLEFVVRTIYNGERKGMPSAEVLSRQRFIVEEV